MSIGRLLTHGLGSFGGRKYLPTLGYGSFAGAGAGPEIILCMEALGVFAPGADAVGVFRNGDVARGVFAPGAEAVQVGCCH